VLRKAGVGSGSRVALLSANRADAWGAGVAAQALGAAVTSLHPTGSREVQAAQLGDSEVSALVVDPVNFGTRGGELAASFPDVAVFTLGPAEYGNDVLASSVREGTSAPRDLAAQLDTRRSLSWRSSSSRYSRATSRSHLSVTFPAQMSCQRFCVAEPCIFSKSSTGQSTGRRARETSVEDVRTAYLKQKR